MPEGPDPMQFPEAVRLENVQVDDATAKALQAWMYPVNGASGPPAGWRIERLERNHLDGTVSLVLRPKMSAQG